jgi:polar amino acid transport system substrate-binding protein
MLDRSGIRLASFLALVLWSSLAHAGGLDRVRAKGELAWGLDAQGGAPYAFQDPRDPSRLVGFEVELAEGLARRLGVRLRPVQAPWERLLELLGRGDFDLAMNGLELTDDKRRAALSTRPYYAGVERLTVRRGESASFPSVASLAGLAVGTLPGSLAEKLLSGARAEVRTYGGGQGEIYDDLRLGRTRAVLLDEPATRYYGALEPDLAVLPGAYGELRYGGFVHRDEPDLAAAIDAAFGAMAQDGELQRTYEKWGLWNPETAALFGAVYSPSPGGSEGWEAWRAAVGRVPPFWERVRARYPSFVPVLAEAAATTLAVSLCAMLLAVLLGVVLALTRVYGPRPARWAAVAYVEFFRGTPLLVQLTMIYFGLPELGVSLPPFAAGVVALGLNYAAAEAENYRAGIASVPAGQLDAALVLGLSRAQAVRHVVAPQALRIALPPATNDFIALLKDSSLVSLVTLTELTKAYSSLANATRDHLGLGLVVALWYLAIGMPFAYLARRAEARLGRHLRPAA